MKIFFDQLVNNDDQLLGSEINCIRLCTNYWNMPYIVVRGGRKAFLYTNVPAESIDVMNYWGF